MFVLRDIHSKLSSNNSSSMYSGINARACAKDFATNAVSLIGKEKQQGLIVWRKQAFKYP